MKFEMSKGANVNYVGTLVSIQHLRPHTNADRLQIATIFGNSVVVGLDVKIGDVGMFFPLESQLQPQFLHSQNLYRTSSMNADDTKQGFFEDHGRVKAVKLRGEKSEGIFIPLSTITSDVAGDIKVGTDFDTIDDVLVVKKYVIKNTQIPGSGKTKSDKKVVKKFDKIVEKQFRLHVDTEQLKKNIHKLQLDDVIGVHYKKHGTSWVVGNVLTNKQLTWKEKVAKWLGIDIVDKEYDIIYSSRKVIKNQYINTEQKQGYYDYDLWKDIADSVKEYIPKGWTLYGEAIGYLPNGGYIQSPFDYGCEPGEYKIYVYRITVTNPDGQLIELDDKQIQEFCEKYGFLYRDTFMFYGTVKDHIFDLVSSGKLISRERELSIIDDINKGDNRWRDIYLELLVAEYNEKDCYMCANPVPEEGVVIRKQKLYDYEAFKLKSFRFLEKESSDLTKGVVDLESQN